MPGQDGHSICHKRNYQRNCNSSTISLGEDDSISSTRYQFSHAKEMTASLLQIAKENPGISGFQLDLETKAPFDDADRRDYAKFLSDMTASLHDAPHGPLRFSADLECRDPATNTIMSNCSAVELTEPKFILTDCATK